MDSIILFCSSPVGLIEGLTERYTVGFATQSKYRRYNFRISKHLKFFILHTYWWISLKRVKADKSFKKKALINTQHRFFYGTLSTNNHCKTIYLRSEKYMRETPILTSFANIGKTLFFLSYTLFLCFFYQTIHEKLQSWDEILVCFAMTTTT